MNTIEYLKKILESWKDSVVNFFPKIILAIVVFFLFFVLGKIAKKISSRFYSGLVKTHPDIVNIISAAIFFFFLLSGVFITLEILGLESVLTKLLAGAGVIGIIAGFAFKDIASNVFAGLLLTIQRPFQPGDSVQIDGNYGTVLQIGWLTTAIETIQGQEVFVPNNIIYNSTFMNFSTFKKRRVILQSAASNTDDLDHIRTAILDEVSKIETLLKEDTIDFYYTSISNTGYNFETRFCVEFDTENNFLQVISDTIVNIKKRFANENITLVNPITT